MVLGKKARILSVSAGAAFFLVLLLVAGRFALRSLAAHPRQSWNANAITATYVGSELRQLDDALAGLFLSYDLQNNTDRDYGLVDGPGVVIMGRLTADHSLTQEEPIKLTYPAFLPAYQRVRIAIEIPGALAWPARGDPAFDGKLKNFVREKLAKVEEFVVFDEVNRCQIELPSAWQQLERNAPVKD